MNKRGLYDGKTIFCRCYKKTSFAVLAKSQEEAIEIVSDDVVYIDWRELDVSVEIITGK